MKALSDSEKLMHAGFEMSLLIKGIDGALEVLGSVLFLFINPQRLSELVRFLTLRELSEDTHDYIATMLITLSQDFSVSLQVFLTLYLVTHGMAKVVLVYLLQKRKLWSAGI